MRTTETVGISTLQQIATLKSYGYSRESLLHAIAEIYGESLSQNNIFDTMLKACNFDWVNENITPENFPIAEEPSEDTEYELVCLERTANTDEAEAEIKRRGLVPADLADLLLYVRKNPDKQRKYPIVALGSRWQNLSGRWCSPCVNDWYGERCLDLYWRGYDWNDSCRFLARKPR